jgi:hypothetical protein
MLRHFESSPSLGTFDPNMIGAQERLIWLQRLRSGHDVWDDGLPRTADTAADDLQKRLCSAIPD